MRKNHKMTNGLLADGLEQGEQALGALPAEVGGADDALHHGASVLGELFAEVALVYTNELVVEQVVVVAEDGQFVVVLVVQVDGGGRYLVAAECEAADVGVVAQVALVGVLVEELDAVEAVLPDAVNEVCQLAVDVGVGAVVEGHGGNVVHVGLHGVLALEVDQRAVLEEDVGERLPKRAPVLEGDDRGLEVAVEGGDGGALLGRGGEGQQQGGGEQGAAAEVQ